MKVLRMRFFSSYATDRMITKITEKLDRDRISDYEITSKIPKDVISVFPDSRNTRVYIPEDLEYYQYDIDDFIRSMIPSMRTNTSMERDIYIMKVYGGTFNETQLYKLVKFIIDETDFCSLLNDEN